MKLKSFLEFVEIQTKIASLFPFVFGVLYSIFLGFDINIINTLIMFVALLSLDMGTTAINNYLDYKKAINEDYKNNINVMGKYNFSEKIGLGIIFALLSICVLFGLLLTVRTNLVVLALGGISFLTGVIYTFGPMPISRTPFGEIVSGLVMGFLIIFITIYIQDTSSINLAISKDFELSIFIDLIFIFNIFMVSLPFVLAISNIMLGNNIRDYDIDINNGRFLLPHYIGVDRGYMLLKINYILIFVAICLSIVFGFLSKIAFIMLFILPIVRKNWTMYEKEIRAKRRIGFKYVILNMIFISISYIITLVFCIIF